jgi:hypothetical protein
VKRSLTIGGILASLETRAGNHYLVIRAGKAEFPLERDKKLLVESGRPNAPTHAASGVAVATMQSD